MFDPETTGPTPADLGVRATFERVIVSIPALIEAASESGVAIEGRRFVDCVIIGPAVLVPTPQTGFANCNFGDAAGEPRNLFLTPAGSKVIGGLSVAGCVFDGCQFSGIGLVGDESVIAAFLGTIGDPA
ncbi:hypothetical protein [Brevundimonas sp. R86498]|uniref:hypothetical protein n=1 Tax=Brevundimonas sp. R86498 TaxID=3093845 RepID=UPI0037C7E310